MTDCPSLSRQDQKRGLKGVVGVVWVGEHGPANALDHRSVPGNERNKGCLGSGPLIGPESLQKLSVTQPDERACVE
jgi:hypothetical protein